MEQNTEGNMRAKQMSPLTLAYLGDAVYELMIRRYLVEKEEISPGQLHQAGVRFANAQMQARAVRQLWDAFTEEEQNMIRRGKNAKVGSLPKSCTPQEYHLATGFECMMGYLYLSQKPERCQAIFDMVLQCGETE